jgi:CBS-domain-containing membrane protein
MQPSHIAPTLAGWLRAFWPEAISVDWRERLRVVVGAAQARYNQVLDISRDDLKALLEDTQLQAYQRKPANLRCGDIMSRALVTVLRDTPLAQAWALFRAHRIKALPVVGPTGSRSSARS